MRFKESQERWRLCVDFLGQRFLYNFLVLLLQPATAVRMVDALFLKCHHFFLGVCC